MQLILSDLKNDLYFEDFAAGQFILVERPIHVTAESIKNFAKDFDPQIFHLDEEGAKNTFFQGLAASGWHTASMGMRQCVDTLAPHLAGGLIGVSVDKLRWYIPVRPGDALTARIDILNKARSRSKPAFGTVQLAWTLFRQDQSVMMSLEAVIWVALRHPDAPVEA